AVPPGARPARHVGGAGAGVQRRPGAGAADRSQSAAQAAPPQPCQKTAGLSGINKEQAQPPEERTPRRLFGALRLRDPVRLKKARCNVYKITDRKSTRLTPVTFRSRMPSSAR